MSPRRGVVLLVEIGTFWTTVWDCLSFVHQGLHDVVPLDAGTLCDCGTTGAGLHGVARASTGTAELFMLCSEHNVWHFTEMGEHLVERSTAEGWRRCPLYMEAMGVDCNMPGSPHTGLGVRLPQEMALSGLVLNTEADLCSVLLTICEYGMPAPPGKLQAGVVIIGVP